MPTRAPLIRSRPNRWGLLTGVLATLMAAPPAMAQGDTGSGAAVRDPQRLASDLGPTSGPAPGADTGRGSGSPGLYTPGVLDPEAGLPGPWERGLEVRRNQLERSKGEVAAISGLVGLVDDLYGEIDQERLVKMLTGVHEDRRHDPLVRAEAGRSLARLHALAGRAAAARTLMEASGWVLNWELVGPFDNAGKMGHDAVYDPETTVYEASQSFRGKLPDEPLRWQHREGGGAGNGYISFDEAVAPNIHVTGYASAWIKVPRRVDAALHVGSGGAYKVWVDGDLVGEGEAYRQPHAIQDGYGVTLSPGWHRVVVKLGVEEGLWGFFLRVSDAKGAPIRGLKSWSGPGAPDGVTAAAASESPRTPRTARTARGALETAVKGSRATAAQYEALAALYRWHRPFAPESSAPTAFAREMDARLTSPRSAWSASFLVQDFNEARAFVASGIERARAGGEENRALLGTMLAELARRDSYLGLERRANEGYNQASATSPDDVYIELSRLNALSGDGFTLGAVAWLDDMVARYPGSLFLRRAAADLQTELGRPREALARYTNMLEEHPGNESLRETVIGLLMSLGEVQEAVKQARARAAASSSSARNWVSLARLEVALGRPDDAMRSMQRAIEIKPLNSEYHRLAGVILTDHGHVNEGLVALRRSLELRPQQPGVQDLIAVLDPRDDAGMLERYDVPLEEIVAAAAPRPAWEGKEAAVLHDMEVVRMLDNGLSERLEHRVVQVLDERGTRSQSVQVTSYDPSESYVEVRRARVRRADGRVEELGETDVVSMVESGYRMYYDKRQVQVSFPGLRVGDVVEVVFAHRPVARRNIFDDYFGDVAILGGRHPIDHKTYVLEAPADRPLFFNVPVDRTLSEDGSLATYRIERSDLEGVKSEGSMPGWSEVFEFVHVSTFESWEDVGDWYWDLVKGQLVVNDEIRAGVEEAIESLPRGATRRDKVGAIYRQVVRNTRYVGLEFGIHGYKPYRTTEVFDRRFGDCKDKASLLKVMLAEAGIDSHLVLVRTRDQGKLKRLPASLAVFNHAIVYVPEFDLFLDGTAEWSGDSELPANDQGASVLVVEDGAGARFTTIPISEAGDNVYAVEETVTLQPDGQATLRQKLKVTGTQAPGRRSMYEAPDKRLELLARNLGASFPGAEVEDATFDSIEDILLPVEMNYTFRAPEWASSTERGLRFDLLGGREGMVRRIAPQVSRTHPLVLGVPFRLHRRGVVRAPEGQVFVASPADATLRSEFGAMRLRASAAEAEATYELVMEFSAIQIPPERYEEFRAFLAEIDARLRMAFETGAAQ